MNFLNKLQYLFSNDANEKNETENSGLNPSDDEINQFFGSPFAVSGSSLTAATYYACMLIRCNAVAKLPLKLMKSDNKGSEKALDHPLYQLFKSRPNPFTTPHDFLWATEFQRLEYGNAYWAVKSVRGKVEELYLLNSPSVSIVIDNTGILDKANAVYYIYQDAKKGMLVYRSDEIVHFKNFSQNGIEGSSIKKYLSSTVANEQYAKNILHEKYRTGLQDPLVVEYTGDLNEAKKNSIKKKFADMGGAKNAGQVIPIPTDFKLIQLETKLVNSQFFQLQGLTTRQIANGFGVKGFQLNDMEKSTYNNIEQQNKAFYSDTLQNVLTNYEQEIDYKLLTVWERQEGYYSKFNVDSILRSDLAGRTASYVSGVSSGYMTIAEVRAKEDLPYMEGTERLMVGNGASIYLDDLGKQYQGGGSDGEA